MARHPDPCASGWPCVRPAHGFRPLGVAEGATPLARTCLAGARRVDHHAVRVDAARAAALVHLAGGIDGLELDAHDSPS